jgi:hypothetical protein
MLHISIKAKAFIDERKLLHTHGKLHRKTFFTSFVGCEQQNTAFSIKKKIRQLTGTRFEEFVSSSRRSKRRFRGKNAKAFPLTHHPTRLDGADRLVGRGKIRNKMLIHSRKILFFARTHYHSRKIVYIRFGCTKSGRTFVVWKVKCP